MEAWQRIKARISQLFEPTLWELEIFALQHGIKWRDKALAQWEAKYWDEVKRGNQASAELEAVKAQLMNETMRRNELEDYVAANAMGDALRQPVPVKVRFDCTWQAVQDAYYRHQSGSPEGQCWHQVMNYLAAHAVIDAPAGVPSVEELKQIWNAAGEFHSAITAIRDAVLAGVREENSKVNELPSDAWQQLEELGVVPNSLIDEPAPQTVSTAQPTPEQVEALARVLMKSASFSNEPHQWETVPPEWQRAWCDAARAAFAHIQPERPKGLPTRDEMAQIIYRAGWCQSYVWDDNDGGSERKQIYDEADAILAALAPWLRDPVGWELDVTSEEMYDKWNDFTCDEDRSFQAVLDLCRSRIRPVMECKECADNKRLADVIGDSDEDK